MEYRGVRRTSIAKRREGLGDGSGIARHLEDDVRTFAGRFLQDALDDVLGRRIDHDVRTHASGKLEAEGAGLDGDYPGGARGTRDGHGKQTDRSGSKYGDGGPGNGRREGGMDGIAHRFLDGGDLGGEAPVRGPGILRGNRDILGEGARTIYSDNLHATADVLEPCVHS